MTSARIRVAERRHGPAEIARDAPRARRRERPRAARSAGNREVVGGARLRFWQNRDQGVVSDRNQNQIADAGRCPRSTQPRRLPPRRPCVPRPSVLLTSTSLCCLPSRPRNPQALPAGNRQRPQAAATLRPRWLLRRWCWEPYFLPWFAAKGYAAYALSLRGHGASRRRAALFVAGLDDYAADVEHVAARLPRAAGADRPLHGRGRRRAADGDTAGARRGAARAGAAVGAADDGGAACRRAAPNTGQIAQFDPTRAVHARARSAAARSISARMSAGDSRRSTTHIGTESPRALLDLALRLHWQLPSAAARRCSCWASTATASATPDDVRATARHHGVEATIVPGLAHMMMLEREWERPARALAALAGDARSMRFASLERGPRLHIRTLEIVGGQRPADPVALEAVAAARRGNRAAPGCPRLRRRLSARARARAR